MSLRSRFAACALLALAVRADAQQTAAHAVTRVIGQVIVVPGEASDAIVELLRDGVVVRGGFTRADGRFEFDSIGVDEYRLRVRKLGFLPEERRLSLVGPVDSVHIELRTAAAGVDSQRRAELGKRMADVRARPRRWACRASTEDVQAAAVATYREFLGSGERFAALARSYGMPAKQQAFLRGFRTISGVQECRRLAEAIDRQFGLLDDQLRVFRVGNVYFLPDFGDGGMVVDLEGKILAVFIAPS